MWLDEGETQAGFPIASHKASATLFFQVALFRQSVPLYEATQQPNTTLVSFLT